MSKERRLNLMPGERTQNNIVLKESTKKENKKKKKKKKKNGEVKIAGAEAKELRVLRIKSDASNGKNLGTSGHIFSSPVV
jgi:hypothetical protein